MLVPLHIQPAHKPTFLQILWIVIEEKYSQEMPSDGAKLTNF
jgi:hypothetical protein